MRFWHYKKGIYPLIAIASGLLVMAVGLVFAKTLTGSYFLLGAFLWFALFGYYRACLKLLPAFLLVGGIFFAIFYFVAKEPLAAMTMANRVGAIFLAIVPGISTAPLALTRSLSAVRTPRAITLGMLIAMSFAPKLAHEVRRVREAMKTRGAGSIFGVKVFYRAFLVPLITRLVGISDTLALSIETRGFELGGAPYTIYKRERVNFLDAIFALGLIAGAVLAVLAVAL